MKKQLKLILLFIIIGLFMIFSSCRYLSPGDKIYAIENNCWFCDHIICKYMVTNPTGPFDNPFYDTCNKFQIGDSITFKKL